MVFVKPFHVLCLSKPIPSARVTNDYTSGCTCSVRCSFTHRKYVSGLIIMTSKIITIATVSTLLTATVLHCTAQPLAITGAQSFAAVVRTFALQSPNLIDDPAREVAGVFLSLYHQKIFAKYSSSAALSPA